MSITPKRLLIGGAAVLVAALVVWWIASASSGGADRPGEHEAVSGREAADGHAHEDKGHALEETGPEVWRETGAEGEYLDITDTPERFIEQGRGLASSWVTFDSSEGPAQREAQLSAYVPNAGEWTELPEDLLHPEGLGTGDAGWRAVSRASGAPSIEESWTFSADGEHSVSVNIPFEVRYSASAGAPKPVKQTWNWSFVFDGEGRLVDVEGPEK